MATRGLDSHIVGIEGRHISIFALSEYHVDYVNRKGWYSVIMQGEPFHR